MKNEFKRKQEEHPHSSVCNLFTLCNAVCGFTSVMYTLQADAGGIPAVSLCLIFTAMIFDLLDGLAARLMNAQSLLGMNLDSLSDVVSFGVAPAAIIYRLVADETALAGHYPAVAWFAATFYLGCAVWRLAQYNTLAIQETDDSSDFIGLPSPGAAALVCAMAVLIPALDLDIGMSITACMAYSLASAYLMVSNVPYTHVRRSLTYSRKWVAVLFIAAFIASIFLFKVWAMVAWAHVYAFAAPLIALEQRVMHRRHANV